jgi:hypothetical protein
MQRVLKLPPSFEGLAYDPGLRSSVHAMSQASIA